MKAVGYVIVRYGATFLTALLLSTFRTPLPGLGVLILVAAAICAGLSDRKAGNARVSLATAFAFELPGAIAASLLGWGLGALVHR